MDKITVIGAGVMGWQIALQCALHGFGVALNDNQPDMHATVGKYAREYLAGRVAKGRITAEQEAAALAKLHLEPQLAVAVAGARRWSSKRLSSSSSPRPPCSASSISSARLLRYWRPNSSNIRGSRLAAVTGRSERVLNLHFFNPALVMELVEVVVHPTVAADTIEAATAFCRRIGKIPVLLRKEIPGFIVNRIFRALTREAVRLYEEGYASVEDIDLAVTKGLGHPLGPLRLLDTTGIDVSYLARMDEYNETGDEMARPNRTLQEMYEKGQWGKKTGRGFYSYSSDGEK